MLVERASALLDHLHFKSQILHLSPWRMNLIARSIHFALGPHFVSILDIVLGMHNIKRDI